MELKSGKILVNNEYRLPIYNFYTNELIGYEIIKGRRPSINDVYLGLYNNAPECLRGLKWVNYGIQGWDCYVCIEDN